MLDHNLHLDAIAATDMPQPTLPPPPWKPGGCHLASGQLLAPLQLAIASWHHRFSQKGNQVIIRFHNGYGAIISEYLLLEGIYGVTPLRFLGPEVDNYEFYFRSHVPDLTWCSERDEMLRVCEQISRLLPTPTV
jgi:hypothetical protein